MDERAKAFQDALTEAHTALDTASMNAPKQNIHYEKAVIAKLEELMREIRLLGRGLGVKV